MLRLKSRSVCQAGLHNAFAHCQECLRSMHVDQSCKAFVAITWSLIRKTLWRQCLLSSTQGLFCLKHLACLMAVVLDLNLNVYAQICLFMHTAVAHLKRKREEADEEEEDEDEDEDDEEYDDED